MYDGRRAVRTVARTGHTVAKTRCTVVNGKVVQWIGLLYDGVGGEEVRRERMDVQQEGHIVKDIMGQEGHTVTYTVQQEGRMEHKDAV